MKKNSYKLSYYALIILVISLVSLLAGRLLFSRDPSSTYRRLMRQIWKNTSKWEKMEYCLTYVLDYPQIIRLKCKLKEKKVN